MSIPESSRHIEDADVHIGRNVPADTQLRIRRRGWHCRMALAIGLCFATASASAQDLSPAIMADNCASCHGPNGMSPGTIPPLDGLDAETIAARLRGFKNGEIEVTIMNRIARAYSEAEIVALSQYLAARQN